MDDLNLDKFGTICGKICLNLPSAYQWRMDQQFDIPVIVFEKQDTMTIYFPITQEFDETWNIKTIEKLIDMGKFSDFENAEDVFNWWTSDKSKKKHFGNKQQNKFDF